MPWKYKLSTPILSATLKLILRTLNKNWDAPAQIIIILDNASFHKNKEIIDKISSNFPKIKLEYLPPYSPDYNLV
jgi:transposase